MTNILNIKKNKIFSIYGISIIILLGTIIIVFITRFLSNIKPCNQGYFSFYNSTYQQSPEQLEEDIEAVRMATQRRTSQDIKFFQETDVDIIPSFKSIVPEANKMNMYWSINNPLVYSIIIGTKLYYNRARPDQVAEINSLSSTSANTPSYPSGHALQSFILAKTLSKKFPDKKDDLNQLAERIADIRKIGGIHFPSDKEFARQIVNKMFWL